MASVSILSPAAPISSTMTSRRAPLASVPNAVNSPFRTIAATSGKRTRAQTGDQQLYGQPPAKKQIIEISDDDGENVDPRKRLSVTSLDKLDDPFAKRSNGQPTALDRRLASVREKKSTVQQPPVNKERAPQKFDADNLESIRQWQRHFKRQFPQFVIYFDGVHDDARLKAVHQIRALGAREEKFFSKAVTHVVTTRPIPPELNGTTPDDDGKSDATERKTVQPAAAAQDQRRTTSLLDANLQRRGQSQAALAHHDVDLRKGPGHTVDILSRARQLNIKIWALEKLQRMLRTMLDTDTGEQVAQDTRSQIAAGRAPAKPTKDADLEQMLRHEKVNGPADRDMTVTAQDMCVFRGCYVYVHDMDERTKPVMVRDYPKPAVKEEGKWPQFRLTQMGRCPFVEDPAHTKKLQQQETAAAKAQEELASAQGKTRAASTRSAAAPPALAERQVNLRRSPRKLDPKPELSKPLAPPQGLLAKRQSSAECMPPLFGSAQQTQRGLPRMVGGEPVASGMQASNITSAIRSQYISSAAMSSTAPGANHRVGDSKEVSALKRKVLERGASVPSNHSIPSSYMNDMRAAINNDNKPPPRAAKRKAQETLGVLHEHDENDQGQPRLKHRKPAPRRRKPIEKDPKPGYCENCRDKFEDFDEVCPSHRPFCPSHHPANLLTSTSNPANTASLHSLKTTGRSSTVSSANSSGPTRTPRCHMSSPTTALQNHLSLVSPIILHPAGHRAVLQACNILHGNDDYVAHGRARSSASRSTFFLPILGLVLHGSFYTLACFPGSTTPAVHLAVELLFGHRLLAIMVMGFLVRHLLLLSFDAYEVSLCAAVALVSGLWLMLLASMFGQSMWVEAVAERINREYCSSHC